MDLATLLGMIGAMAIVGAAILTGGSAPVFFNVPSILIVIGGTVLVVMIKFSLAQFLGAFKVAGRAFSHKTQDPEKLIAEIVQLANIGRKEGLLALEKAEVTENFLKEGIRMLIDGNSQEVVEAVMNKDMSQTIDRHSWGEKVFRATGDVAPAMGMIGTLIGLVQMLSNMSDPKAIGPAMAVALLTTLYGAVLANMIALPIADKLNLRKSNEKMIHSMCIDGVLAIQAGQNPRIIESMLKAYLDPNQRASKKGK
ncbi:MAG: flagellar motor protein PomA [Halieaceae bacterium]|jgi:chemotaxis protein MotA|nr:flagellar motor protein PomA [Halieaceae bacterium]